MKNYNKTEICVPIRNEEELQQAKEMLEKNGEKIDKDLFELDTDECLNYLSFHVFCNDWFIGVKGKNTEIPLSELESVLKGGSESESKCNLYTEKNDCDMFRFRKEEACKFCKHNKRFEKLESESKNQSSIDEKQKAKELVEKFYRYSKGQTNEARLINAKFSALECVKEVIKEYDTPFIMPDDRLIFWQNVKIEIQNYENI